MQINENLAAIVREVEEHIGAAGWDQPVRLFALVSSKDLIAAEPDLARELNITEEMELTSVEQEVSIEQDLEELLSTIAWPENVQGALLALERIILPPAAESTLPLDDEQQLLDVASDHPDRRDVRLLSAVLRTGENLNAIRYRDHDEIDSVAIAPDLVPSLNESLLLTFSD